MSELPQPLTPPDCDLRDFQFIPVDVRRLLTSETWVLGTGDERAAAMTLWLESWHQVPAASIPKADRMLAHLSQAKSWSRVKAHALRGWIEASDGRLYHPVVAEKALEAWIEKLANSLAGTAGNAKRWGLDIETDSIKQRALDAIGMLRKLAPQSKTLKKKVVAMIEAGSRPESGGDVGKLSGGESGGDTSKVSGGDRKGQGQGQGQGYIEEPPPPLASTVGATGQAAETGRSNPRNVQIAVLLRKLGVKPMTSMHPEAVAWGGDLRVTDAILTAAMEEARQYKGDSESIHPNYLKPIVERLIAPAPPRTNGNGTSKANGHAPSWRSNPVEVERIGREINVLPQGSDTYASYADRVEAELRKQGRLP